MVVVDVFVVLLASPLHSLAATAKIQRLCSTNNWWSCSNSVTNGWLLSLFLIIFINDGCCCPSRHPCTSSLRLPAARAACRHGSRNSRWSYLIQQHIWWLVVDCFLYFLSGMVVVVLFVVVIALHHYVCRLSMMAAGRADGDVRIHQHSVTSGWLLSLLKYLLLMMVVVVAVVVLVALHHRVRRPPLPRYACCCHSAISQWSCLSSILCMLLFFQMDLIRRLNIVFNSTTIVMMAQTGITCWIATGPLFSLSKLPWSKNERIFGTIRKKNIKTSKKPVKPKTVRQTQQHRYSPPRFHLDRWATYALKIEISSSQVRDVIWWQPVTDCDIFSPFSSSTKLNWWSTEIECRVFHYRLVETNGHSCMYLAPKVV